MYHPDRLPYYKTCNYTEESFDDISFSYPFVSPQTQAMLDHTENWEDDCQPNFIRQCRPGLGTLRMLQIAKRAVMTLVMCRVFRDHAHEPAQRAHLSSAVQQVPHEQQLHRRPRQRMRVRRGLCHGHGPLARRTHGASEL